MNDLPFVGIEEAESRFIDQLHPNPISRSYATLISIYKPDLANINLAHRVHTPVDFHVNWVYEWNMNGLERHQMLQSPYRMIDIANLYQHVAHTLTIMLPEELHSLWDRKLSS